MVGVLLVVMTLGGSFISRLPLSAAMLYLGVGMAIGPWGWGLVKLDAFKDVTLLERLTEVALLISLFTAGMKLELPLKDKRWRIPVQLATVSMLVTVAAITALARPWVCGCWICLWAGPYCWGLFWPRPTRYWPRMCRWPTPATVTACALA